MIAFTFSSLAPALLNWSLISFVYLVAFLLIRFTAPKRGTSMVLGTKIGRRKKTATKPIASPSGTFALVIVTPQTL
ncbi:hypothetical protein LOK49_LG04G00193 [Camellia lanceoleosa]|uniref:Uncharacterized protein n=1 Tax=Camellia lanceoleosa TaxID=1840588 RepID=A0ACC0I0X7_9ERIC|nr:hypothetical protein LOK49_LG04G00193 [Camellia lanceoleosa]